MLVICITILQQVLSAEALLTCVQLLALLAACMAHTIRQGTTPFLQRMPDVLCAACQGQGKMHKA